MRNLSEIEKNRLALLTENLVEVALLEPTQTGLRKSILDATATVRDYLAKHRVHDYDTQAQGPDHKATVPTFFLTPSLIIPNQASLYRPVTKNGDPRIWFRGLPAQYVATDILVLVVFEQAIYILNLTSTPLENILNQVIESPISSFIANIRQQENIVSIELLAKLRTISKTGWIEAQEPISSDTSIGRTLENCLGIPMNSSKSPDYKGIELKSSRKRKQPSRQNLFAQVPDWEHSVFKSSEQILDAFGYSRGQDFKLYCTVDTVKRNSQGLILRLEDDLKRLFENSARSELGDFVVWQMQTLHNRLVTKHNETFWISAETRKTGSVESFLFKDVLHTRKPIISQFDILLQQGLITVDHLIKRKTDGRVSEKGPLFKINPKVLQLLFPPSQTYSLLEE